MKGIIFCHGWASHPNFWNNLKEYFLDIPCIFWDLGYFSPINCSLPNNQELSEWVGIGHSLGFLKLLQSSLPLKTFIGIQGFINFIGHHPDLQKIRRKELSSMLYHFKYESIKVVSAFQKRCELPVIGSNTDLNIDILLSDLLLLEKDYASLVPNRPFLLFGSQKDIIVTPDLLKDNFARNPNARLVMHENANHNLGFQDGKFIYENVRKFMRDNFGS